MEERKKKTDGFQPLPEGKHDGDFFMNLKHDLGGKIEEYE
jgi:hypothetical protein